MDALSSFHPAIRTWFERRFPAGPTPPQQGGWPAIARGRDTLIAAPTGSGKTLSAFLVSIDRIFRAETARVGAVQSGLFEEPAPDPEPSSSLDDLFGPAGDSSESTSLFGASPEPSPELLQKPPP